MAAGLLTLAPDELTKVVLHPVQQHAHAVITDLISDLRTCETPADYGDYQRALFQAVYTAEIARAEVRRVVKRVRRGQPLPADALDLPSGVDPSDPSS